MLVCGCTFELQHQPWQGIAINRGDYNAVLKQILYSIPAKAFSCTPYEAVSNRSTQTHQRGGK